MAYATVLDMELLPSFKQMCELSKTEIETLLVRGENYINRYAKRTFYDETETVIVEQLKWANILLAEYFWYLDDPGLREATLMGIQGESIGSYSYTIKNNASASLKETTGNAELDSILDWLKDSSFRGFNYFGVNGPSRAEKETVLDDKGFGFL